jgi:DNA (cytosine-5)-methyltransferase 1
MQKKSAAKKRLRFIDLFAGIGGFHLAFHRQGAECVYASEKDPFARKTYFENFKKLSPELFDGDLLGSPYFNDDITTIKNIAREVKDHDILCAGFPCQPFSQAGHKRGFNEEHEDRGNMFFWIRDILAVKRPKAFFLENVRHLENHDDGRTFDTIKQILTKELNYTIYWKIVKASDYGLPQHRPRIFIIGFSNEYVYPEPFEFPEKKKLKFNMSDVWGGECSREIGFTLRVGGKGSGIDDRRNWDAYLVDGEVRRLGVEEGKKMMGFPKSYKFPVAKGQAMKQLGNSVAVDAIQAVAEQMVLYLTAGKKKKTVK